MRLKWRLFWFEKGWQWRDLLVRLKLRKAPPKADPRSQLVGGVRWLFDPPRDKRELH